jgi:hypothetical protein
MTSRDFVIWLKGFATAANSYNITPKQWDEIKDKLDIVEDTPQIKPTPTCIQIPPPKESKIF